MKDEKELRKIYKVVLDSWQKLYKPNAGSPAKDWDAIVEESSRMLREAGNDREAFHIVWGFLKALEEEEQQAHGKSNNGS